MDGCFCQAGWEKLRQGREPAPLPQHLSCQRAAWRAMEKTAIPHGRHSGPSGARPGRALPWLAAGASSAHWGLILISSGRRASPAGRAATKANPAPGRCSLCSTRTRQLCLGLWGHHDAVELQGDVSPFPVRGTCTAVPELLRQDGEH